MCIRDSEKIISDYRAANDGDISLGQLAIFEADFYNELKQLGLNTEIPRPSIFTGDETSSQGNESYSRKVGVVNQLKSKADFKTDWETELKTDQDPFPKLNRLQILAIPGAEAELEKRIRETMRMTGSTFDEAFSKHYFQVLKELKLSLIHI